MHDAQQCITYGGNLPRLCVSTEVVKMPKRKQKSETGSDIELAKMKVVQLKEELKKRRLSSSGKKAELVARLEDAIHGAGKRPRERQ